MSTNEHTDWQVIDTVHDIVRTLEDLNTGCRFSLYQPSTIRPTEWQIDVTLPDGNTDIVSVQDIVPSSWTHEQTDHVHHSAVTQLLARAIRSLA